ncbi:ankyrin repeat domain-containing protein [Streptomyces nigra]|uniref:ankyrin repeat domain-containing protein n=1 Tax=Streptomyces nigra TaxID=1827580 RepID=UPI00367437EF
MHYAAADGDVEALRCLPTRSASPTRGAGPEDADAAGWTPPHSASQAQAPSATEVLLAAGASVDAVDGHGKRPWWRAVFCLQGGGAAIRLLLEAGADPTASMLMA